MWSALSSRSHHGIEIFPFTPISESEAELMLYGTIEYNFKHGGDDSKDWAAIALLIKDGPEGESTLLGRWKMNFYQVYLVRTCSPR